MTVYRTLTSKSLEILAHIYRLTLMPFAKFCVIKNIYSDNFKSLFIHQENIILYCEFFQHVMCVGDGSLIANYILMASLPLHFKMFFATHYRSGPALGSQKMQRRRLSVSYCPLILPQDISHIILHLQFYIAQHYILHFNLVEMETGAAIVH